MVNFLDKRLPDRFWARCMPCPMSGCWLWIGSTHQHGYGQFGIGTAVLRAHRVAYQLLVGAIPSGLEIDHKCFTKCCVNPLHLEAVTHRVNTQRSALLRRVSFCKRGHAKTDDNIILGKRGDGAPLRHCRACHNERRRSVKQYGLTLVQIDDLNSWLRSVPVEKFSEPPPSLDIDEADCLLRSA